MKNAINNSPKFSFKFYCENCDYGCTKKGDYSKHIVSLKHNANLSYENANRNSPKQHSLVCCCGKTYKHQSSFSRHKVQCKINNIDHNINNIDESTTNKDLMNYLLKENSEMKQMMIEMCKSIPNVHNTTTTNINNINNNQKININIFLNEECKDALNMTEFIESIQLTIEDIAKIGELGQTKGMSNILINKLNNLDVLKRPLHCSDIKKEIIYIKDADKWEEEKAGKPKLKHALDEITKKSINALPDMNQEPDDYLKTISEVLRDPREDRKIISEIAKEIYLQ